MVNLFEISVNIFEMFINLMFLTLYFESKYKGIKKAVGFISGLIISVITITYLNSLYIYEGILGLVFAVIYFLYALIFLKGNIYVKLFISGFINCIVYFISMFSTLFMAVILTHDYNKLYNFTAERIMLITLTKVLLFGVYIVLLRFIFNEIAKKKNIIILIIMPIVAELSMIGIMQVFMKHSELKNELLLSAVGVMLANVLIYYMFIKINKDIKLEIEVEGMLQRLESDKKYVRDVKELYSRTCSMRHEMITHLETISGLIGVNDDKALDYIQSVTKNGVEQIQRLVKTDNEWLDAVINVKSTICTNFGIQIQAQIQNNSLGMLEYDEIGTVFGNLFDNAIEAAKNTTEKMINLEVKKRGSRCSIVMLNSVEKSVLLKNKQLDTTKEDKEHHGFGIKNIKMIVDKHDGVIDFFEKDGQFGCSILL